MNALWPVPGADWARRWTLMDLWAARELAMLCCGWDPADSRMVTFSRSWVDPDEDGFGDPDRNTFRDVLEVVKRGVIARTLTPVVEPSAQHTDDWGRTTLFRPADAAAWAFKCYPATFPFSKVFVSSSTQLEIEIDDHDDGSPVVGDGGRQQSASPFVPPRKLAAFGARLRELRNSRGWSHETLARKVKLDKTTVIAHEKGKRSVRPDSLARYAEAFEVTVQDLSPE